MKPIQAIVPLLAGLIACSASPSTTLPEPDEPALLRVTVAPAGAATRPAGFALVVNGTTTRMVKASGTTTISDLGDGPLTLRLAPQPLNCTPDRYAPVAVDLEAGDTVVVQWRVSCDPPAATGILYAASGNRFGSIWRADPDGSSPTELSEDPAQQAWSDGQPVMAPGRTRIAFLRRDQQRIGMLMVMRADGTEQRHLGPVDVGSLDWSPDGDRFAVTYWSSDGTILALWWADGTPDRVLRTAPFGDGIWSPRWSPDGRLVAYAEGAYLYTIDVVTGQRTNIGLASLVDQAIGLAWSHDGTRLAYTADQELRVINNDGTGQQLVTSFDVNAFLDWTSDGRLLVSAPPALGASDGQLVTIPVSGGAIIPLGVAGSGGRWIR